MTYSYSPEKIRDFGKDQLRFEVGDTVVTGGATTCVLGDEEYVALLRGRDFSLSHSSYSSPSSHSLEWLKLKLEVVDGILFRLAYQVNTRIDSLSYDLGSRVVQMEALRAVLDAEIEDLERKQYSKSSKPPMKGNKPYYFHTDMHRNHSVRLGRGFGAGSGTWWDL